MGQCKAQPDSTLENTFLMISTRDSEYHCVTRPEKLRVTIRTGPASFQAPLAPRQLVPNRRRSMISERSARNFKGAVTTTASSVPKNYICLASNLAGSWAGVAHRTGALLGSHHPVAMWVFTDTGLSDRKGMSLAAIFQGYIIYQGGHSIDAKTRKK